MEATSGWCLGKNRKKVPVILKNSDVCQRIQQYMQKQKSSEKQMLRAGKWLQMCQYTMKGQVYVVFSSASSMLKFWNNGWLYFLKSI